MQDAYGIVSEELLDVVVAELIELGCYEEVREDLNAGAIQSVLKYLRKRMRTLSKVMDKGGVVAIEADNTVITAYNVG